MSEHRILLISDSERVTDAVGASAAAMGVVVDQVRAPGEATSAWAEAGVILVGEDQAGSLATHAPPRRDRVYLVGWEAEPLARLSVPLGGQVIVLPEGLALLTSVLSGEPAPGASLVAVVGGSGGVGASTLAAGLALVARRRGVAAALVDADPQGGGIDLLLGAEHTPGWRWPALLGARGQVTDVRRFLPQVDGVTVVAMGRAAPGPTSGAPSVAAPSVEALRAVLDSLARYHDLVVLDAGRAATPAIRALLPLCRRALLVAGSSVRAVASAGCVAAHLDLPDVSLVVRRTPGGRVPPESIRAALGLPLAAVLPEDRGLARAAEEGDVPGRSPRSRWTRAVAALADGLVA